MFSMYLLAYFMAFATGIHAHRAGFTPGLFCKYGNSSGFTDYNNGLLSTPQFKLSFDDFWMAKGKGCLNFPPPAGEMTVLPAGGQAMIEIVQFMTVTTMAYNGTKVTPWGNGQNQTAADLNGYKNNGNCGECCNTRDGVLHTQNYTTVSGVALGISYVSDPSNATITNHAIFSVNTRAPWQRETLFDIPADMPPCPVDGCICSFNWIAEGCGEPNRVHHPFRCSVVGSTSTKLLATAKPPNWAGDDAKNATTGAKQVMVSNMLDFVNVWKPNSRYNNGGYNSKYGFKHGAQNDIFVPGVGKSNTTPQTGIITNDVRNGPVPSPSPSPKPPASGTFYICQKQNWAQPCKNFAWKGNVCSSLKGTVYAQKVQSAGPSQGSTCRLYRDDDCGLTTGDQQIWQLKYPGVATFNNLTTFDNLAVNFSSFTCF